MEMHSCIPQCPQLRKKVELQCGALQLYLTSGLIITFSLHKVLFADHMRACIAVASLSLASKMAGVPLLSSNAAMSAQQLEPFAQHGFSLLIILTAVAACNAVSHLLANCDMCLPEQQVLYCTTCRHKLVNKRAVVAEFATCTAFAGVTGIATGMVCLAEQDVAVMSFTTQRQKL